MKPARLVALLLLVLALGTAPFLAPSASAKPHHGKAVVYVDDNYQASKRPGRIFFYANSGPYLRHLKWKNWGTGHASARGRYISDCASCGPKRNVPARVKLSHLRYSKTLDAYYYGKALLYREPTEGQDNPARFSAGSCPSKG